MADASRDTIDAGVNVSDAGSDVVDAMPERGPTTSTFLDEFDDPTVIDPGPVTDAVVAGGTIRFTPPFALRTFGNGEEGDLTFPCGDGSSLIAGDHDYRNLTISGAVNPVSNDIVLRVAGDLVVNSDLQTPGKVELYVGGTLTIGARVLGEEGVTVHSHSTGALTLNNAQLTTESGSPGPAADNPVHVYARGDVQCVGSCSLTTGAPITGAAR